MKIQERIDNLNKAIKLAKEEKGIKRVKTQELNLTKEDEIAFFNTLTDLYVVVKGKGMFKVVELEEYDPKNPFGLTFITIKSKTRIRDAKGRFIKQ